jgi:outer membrane lipoprotein-sorting protein
MRRFGTCAALLLAVSAAGAATAPAPAHRQAVLAEFDRVQESIRTLTSDFRETTHSPLLKEPIVSKGRVFLTKPDSIRWEYSDPEPMRFVITEDDYTGYFPERNRAEKRKIGRWREQLFRFLGLGQASRELEKFYDIRIEEPGPDMAGTHCLVLAPKKKRVRKRMDEVRFWIDADSYLPVRVEYHGREDGNARMIEFENMRLNPTLGSGTYTVELPPGVEVTTEFSALSGLGPSRDEREE